MKDKKKRYSGGEERGMPRTADNGQILLTESIGIDSGLLRLASCHSVSSLPLVLSYFCLMKLPVILSPVYALVKAC